MKYKISIIFIFAFTQPSANGFLHFIVYLCLKLNDANGYSQI